MPENEQESTASGQAFGPSLPGSFAYFDRDTSSWKTSGLFLFEELTAYSGTWPKRGTMRSGSVFALPTLARPTAESGCSSWPTPMTTAPHDSPWTAGAIDNGRNQHDLAKEVAKHWPTPTSSKADKVSGPRRDGDRTLNGEAKKWNTPRSRDWKGDGKDCLPNQAKQWQTPSASVADAVARGRRFVGCELYPAYADYARQYIANPDPMPVETQAAGQLGLFDDGS